MDPDRPSAGPWRSPHIAVRDAPGKGRGLFATAPIPAGTTIDRSPVMVIPSADRPFTDRTIVFTYTFMWEPDRTDRDLHDGTGRGAVALGLVSMLNHSGAPNARIVKHIALDEIECVARRDIAAGEEITIDYGQDLWFEPA